MNLDSPEYSKTLTYLMEVETICQDILTLKDTKLELANTLSKLQECLRALQKTDDRKSFLKIGSLFIEHPTEKCKTIIQKEINNVKDQYDDVNMEMKEKLIKKRDIEHEPKIKGFGLRPLSHSEATGLMKGFGIK
ncbi:hypothetical protein FQR65_LT07536 [Abscondita terminalis]|nr:hypothetical protein FQR65_LT07536 [Abscondita terminalis]